MDQYDKRKLHQRHIQSVEAIMLRSAVKTPATPSQFNHRHKLNQATYSSSLHKTPKSIRTPLLSTIAPKYSLSNLHSKNSTLYDQNQQSIHITSAQLPFSSANHFLIRHNRPYDAQLLENIRIQKQNLGLAKRIAGCSPTIDSSKQHSEWKVLKKCIKVRSKFKKDLEVEEPRIYKMDKCIGFGRNLYRMEIQSIKLDVKYDEESLFYFCFKVSSKKFNTRLFGFDSISKAVFFINLPRRAGLSLLKYDSININNNEKTIPTKAKRLHSGSYSDTCITDNSTSYKNPRQLELMNESKRNQLAITRENEQNSINYRFSGRLFVSKGNHKCYDQGRFVITVDENTGWREVQLVKLNGSPGGIIKFKISKQSPC